MATAVDHTSKFYPNEPKRTKLFRMVMRFKGSDLHLKVGWPRNAASRGYCA